MDGIFPLCRINKTGGIGTSVRSVKSGKLLRYLGTSMITFMPIRSTVGREKVGIFRVCLYAIVDCL